METSRVGKRGTIVVPAKLRPAVVVPVERYTDERKAEFLLNNAVDAEDYAQAVKEVRKLGLSPSKISHRRPA